MFSSLLERGRWNYRGKNSVAPSDSVRDHLLREDGPLSQQGSQRWQRVSVCYPVTHVCFWTRLNDRHTLRSLSVSNRADAWVSPGELVPWATGTWVNIWAGVGDSPRFPFLFLSQPELFWTLPQNILVSPDKLWLPWSCWGTKKALCCWFSDVQTA